MNYYNHHIGDYDADTAHLGWLEDAAYRRLMCLYYRREQPIPADISQACRLVRAASKQERAAVETVLHEFFEIGPDGWKNKRCEAEIAASQAKAKANRENGKRGGRPRGSGTQPEPNPPPKDGGEETEQKPTGLFVGTHDEPKTNPLKTLASSQEPIANSQEDYGAKAPASSAHKPAGPSAAEVCVALRNAGIAGVNPGHPRLAMLIDAGAVVAEFVAMAPKSIDQTDPFAYLLAAVEGERKRAARTGPTLHRGPLRAVSKQQAIEDENRRVAEAWAAQGGAA